MSIYEGCWRMEPVISFGSYECGCETVPIFEFRSWLPKSNCSLLTFYERKSISEHYQIQKFAFSQPLSLSPSFCAVLIMSRHWAPLLLVLSGLWCACLQVEKRTAVSKAWLLFQAQALALTQAHQCILFSCGRNSAEKFLLGALQNLTLSFFLFPTFISNSSHKKTSDSRKQDVRIHYIPHGAKSPCESKHP